MVGNIGIDGHERGAMVVAHALQDAGMEVIYLGLCQTPETIASCAVQEDTDLIAIGSMCGAHAGILETIRLLGKEGRGDIPIIAGGIIPGQDTKVLKEAGVGEVFGPGTPTSRIVDFVKRRLESKKRITL